MKFQSSTFSLKDRIKMQKWNMTMVCFKKRKSKNLFSGLCKNCGIVILNWGTSNHQFSSKITQSLKSRENLSYCSSQGPWGIHENRFRLLVMIKKNGKLLPILNDTIEVRVPTFANAKIERLEGSLPLIPSGLKFRQPRRLCRWSRLPCLLSKKCFKKFWKKVRLKMEMSFM